MRTFSLLLELASVFVICVTAQNKYCYQDDEDLYIQFTTKTAYELIRAKHEQTSTHDSCTPQSIWAFMRHGTRYPSDEDIEEMKTLLDLRDAIVKNHEKDRNGELCGSDLQNFKNYTFTLSPSYDMRLSTQGKDDLRYLARRLQSKFPTLFNTSKVLDRYLFFNDKSERTVESREAFFDGLLWRPSNSHINNSLQRPNKNCETWLHEVKRNPETAAEYNAYKSSHFVNEMITRINLRLGFQNNKSLGFDEIHLMYASCAYEKAWDVDSRPAFCAVFTKNDLKIFEYLDDLSLYYEYSYGNNLNERLACPLVSDLVQQFKAIVENGNKSDDTEPTGTFYFSHVGVYVPLLTSLKMTPEDHEHLRHNNYEAMSERKFKSSIIFPFAANLVAVLYECTQGDQHQVEFYLNEGIVLYPGCETGLCPWKTVYEKLKSTVEPSSCNWDFCTRDSAATKVAKSSLGT